MRTEQEGNVRLSISLKGTTENFQGALTLYIDPPPLSLFTHNITNRIYYLYPPANLDHLASMYLKNQF